MNQSQKSQSASEIINSRPFQIGCLVFVVLLYLFLSLQHIGDPFMRVSEDTNGANGVAAKNLLEAGPLALKFGVYPSPLRDPSEAFGRFYTNHPAGFIVPTLITYALFGVSEFTTRLGPLLLMTVAFVLFFFALVRVFGSTLPALLGTLAFALLPGSVYYGKHLDMSPPSLALILISFFLYVSYETTQKRGFFLAFLASVLLGGFVGWFYYFFPVAIWLLALYRFVRRQAMAFDKKCLIAIPVLLGIALAGNLLHFWILNGDAAFSTLQAAFLSRASSQPLGAWFARILWIGDLNITWIFSALAAIGAVVLFARRKVNPSYFLLTPIFLTPILIMLAFRQWSLHPFGLTFFLPTVAALTGVLFHALLPRLDLPPLTALKKHFVRFVLTGAVVLAGGYVSMQKLDFFYNQFLILTEQDVVLLKELAPQIGDTDVCKGSDPTGVMYEGIMQWYLGKKIGYSPDCLSSAKIVLAPNPVQAEMFQEEVNKLNQVGYQSQGCSGYWCVLVKQPTTNN